MLTKPEIACAIIEGISYVREDEELQDFVVEVEGKEFKCHRLILSACSGFFRGLLRSGMKESQKRRTKLNGVSVETFTGILETVYTGCDNLTRDNTINFWLAADHLEIAAVFENCVNFIRKNICNATVISYWKVASQLMHQNTIALCENFLRNNISLDNWKIIYCTAHNMGSKLILSHVRNFIKKNYQHVFKSNAFLHLRENDLIEIIRSQDLVVSTEDVVIESVLNWVKNVNQTGSETTAADLNDDVSSVLEGDEQSRQAEDNLKQLHDQNKIVGYKGKNATIKLTHINKNRMRCLERFLSETRLCLVSSITLGKLSRDNLLMDNKRIRAMVMDAALYKSMGLQHGRSLKAAVHRSCSGLMNVGVVGRQHGNFNAFSFQPEFQWLDLPKCAFLLNCTGVKLIAYQTYFIAVGDLAEFSSVCVFVHNKWRELMKLSGHGWLGVAVEEFIYLINSSNQQIQRFDPRFGNCLLEDLISFPTTDKIDHVCSYEVFILAFCSEVIDETAVHCLDTRSQTWTRLDSLEGSAKNMHSFREEKQLYILQANGNLWEINSDEINGVQLMLVEVLWQGTSKINGVIYMDQRLCLCFNKDSENDVAASSISKLFTKISNVFSPTKFLPWSNIVPAVVKSHAR